MHEAIFQTEEKNYYCPSFFKPTRATSTQILFLHFQTRNFQAPAGKHSATFPSEQAGEGTGSMPHIHRLSSWEGEPKHISTGDYNPYLQSAPFPLASPPSCNYNQAATHQEHHQWLSRRERISYTKHAYNVWKHFNTVTAIIFLIYKQHDFPRRGTFKQTFYFSISSTF